jgi:WXXGXW repeat (2 copies)
MTRRSLRGVVGSLGIVLGLWAASPAPGAPWQGPVADVPPPPPLPPADGQPQGAEVLTRGPVHEAFAEPVVFDPKPGPLIPRQPPQPVEEAPPDQKPDGVNVHWIPGYWSWDDSRSDFIWVSGLWRDLPPGRQWVPGYWSQDAGNYRWVTGAWVADRPATAQVQSQAVEYLPAPPASLEAGPSSPAPLAGTVWMPGCWLWQADRYVWRPGFWVASQPDWIWVPAHYVWTPGGYLFVDGYYDRTPERRGTPFAPVYFAQPVYGQPRFVYTPTISLLAAVLVSNLFVRPTCHQYYFGDYYEVSYVQAGIYPAYSFHQSRTVYDPVFAHEAAINLRRDPRWLDQVHGEYQFRRDHPEARPPHTYAAMLEAYNRPGALTSVHTTVVNGRTVTITRNLAFARPIAQIAANPRLAAPVVGRGAGAVRGPEPRFTRIDEQSRREIAVQSAALGRYREQRGRQEAAAAVPRPREAVRANPLGSAPARPGVPSQAAARGESTLQREQPRRVEIPRSPIATAPSTGQPRPAANLPASPRTPAVDRNARPRPTGAGDPRLRPEPRPDQRPRHPSGAGGPEIPPAR